MVRHIVLPRGTVSPTKHRLAVSLRPTMYSVVPHTETRATIWATAPEAAPPSAEGAPFGMQPLTVIRPLWPLATAGATLFLAGASVWPAAPRGGQPLPVPQRQAACLAQRPYLASACYQQWQPIPGPGVASVVAFRDNEPDAPPLTLALDGDVGSVYGLAYYAGTLYAAAYAKYRAGLGPDGPGAIYAIDLDTGLAAPLLSVPNPGSPTPSSRERVAKSALGDIDVSTDGTQLFVTNLNEGRIYRYAIRAGQSLGSFDHGAANESWAADARPFGLKFHAGRLYHGVIDTAQSSQDRSQLAAYVYESQPDGSQMRQVLGFPLAYDRGVVRLQGVIGAPNEITADLDWLPWRDGYHTVSSGARLAVYPQPILADIEFDANNNMLIGLRDRQADVTESTPRVPEKPGFGVGDLIRARFDGAGWQAQIEPEFYYDRTTMADESTLGGLAQLLRSDSVVSGVLVPDAQGLLVRAGAVWYANVDGQRTGGEGLCQGYLSIAPLAAGMHNRRPLDRQDNEILPAVTLGDIELLCDPELLPTDTPIPTTPTWTITLPAPTGSPTATSSPTPSLTPTRPLAPIYLPVGIKDEPCDPEVRAADVALVIDASSTMLELTRANRTKLQAAIEAALGLVDSLRPGSQVAIVSFNVDAYLDQPLTDDRAALDRALSAIRAQQYTRIDLGIQVAKSELLGPRQRAQNQAMIVLTDGRNNPVPVEVAVQRATEAKLAGITIFTVGLGELVETDALRRMASRPEDYRHAPDGEDLVPLYRRIAFEVPCPPSAFWPRRRFEDLRGG
jgi:hypothetical protein